MIDDTLSNIAVLEKCGKIQFINSNTQTLLMKNFDGNIPENFLQIVSDTDKDRFLEALSQSFKSIEPQKLQINLACFTQWKSPRKSTSNNQSENGEELSDELFEMQFTQNRWENKKCIMICFRPSNGQIGENSKLYLQSQSIIHQINDLVLETCVKYERHMNSDGNLSYD